MKVVSLSVLALISAIMQPAVAQAEIYKWRDKDGSIRYSDVPPPSNIKNESIGRKTTRVLPPAESTPAAAINKAATAASKEVAPLSKEEEAAKRAKEAEAQKKADEIKKAELKFRQESCAAARNNLRMYAGGGRIMTTDANGERHYLGDDEINKGKADAQRDVEKFCD